MQSTRWAHPSRPITPNSGILDVKFNQPIFGANNLSVRMHPHSFIPAPCPVAALLRLKSCTYTHTGRGPAGQLPGGDGTRGVEGTQRMRIPLPPSYVNTDVPVLPKKNDTHTRTGELCRGRNGPIRAHAPPADGPVGAGGNTAAAAGAAAAAGVWARAPRADGRAGRSANVAVLCVCVWGGGS